jgi:hypothetical protein
MIHDSHPESAARDTEADQVQHALQQMFQQMSVHAERLARENAELREENAMLKKLIVREEEK